MLRIKLLLAATPAVGLPEAQRVVDALLCFRARLAFLDDLQALTLIRVIIRVTDARAVLRAVSVGHALFGFVANLVDVDLLEALPVVAVVALDAGAVSSYRRTFGVVHALFRTIAGLPFGNIRVTSAVFAVEAIHARAFCARHGSSAFSIVNALFSIFALCVYRKFFETQTLVVIVTFDACARTFPGGGVGYTLSVGGALLGLVALLVDENVGETEPVVSVVYFHALALSRRRVTRGVIHTLFGIIARVSFRQHLKARAVVAIITAHAHALVAFIGDAADRVSHALFAVDADQAFRNSLVALPLLGVEIRLTLAPGFLARHGYTDGVVDTLLAVRAALLDGQHRRTLAPVGVVTLIARAGQGDVGAGGVVETLLGEAAGLAGGDDRMALAAVLVEPGLALAA